MPGAHEFISDVGEATTRIIMKGIGLTLLARTTA
jgi:hypothetical protein